MSVLAVTFLIITISARSLNQSSELHPLIFMRWPTRCAEGSELRIRLSVSSEPDLLENVLL